MTTTHVIKPEHKPVLTARQHVLEWLQREQMRLQAELAHVGQQGMRAERELRDFLAGEYSIAPEAPFTLDVEAGTIHVPDAAGEAAPAPVQDATEAIPAEAVEPDPVPALLNRAARRRQSRK